MTLRQRDYPMRTAPAGCHRIGRRALCAGLAGLAGCAAPATKPIRRGADVSFHDRAALGSQRFDVLRAHLEPWIPRTLAYHRGASLKPLRIIFTTEVRVAIYQRSNIFLPVEEPVDLAWLEEDFVHELAHHLTGHDSTFFMKEGIATATAEAVFGATDRVPGAWPLFGRTTDAWVALMADRAHLLPMATALAWPRYRSETAELDFQSWKIYLQAGSVVGWDVRTRGYGAFLQAFERGRFDLAPEVLERRWRAAITRGRHPSFDPAMQLPERPRYQDFARRLSREPHHSI